MEVIKRCCYDWTTGADPHIDACRAQYEDAIVVVDDEGVVLHLSCPLVPERAHKRIA